MIGERQSSASMGALRDEPAAVKPATSQARAAQRDCADSVATETGVVKNRSLDDELIRQLAARYGTPLFVYDFRIVAERVRDLEGFDVVRYAQKANSNIHLLRRMRELGVKVDAVSAGEVRRALLAGFGEEDIEFTADIFDGTILELLSRHPVHVNVGSPDMVDQLARRGLETEITVRVNPGFGHGHDLKVSTGGRHSKHGVWFDQLEHLVRRTADAGVSVTGVHMHIGSGSDFEHLSKIRECMERSARVVGPELRKISTGGGLPVPYREGEEAFAVDRYLGDWQETQRALESELGRPIALEVEPGRYLVAESGMLITEVRALKSNDGLPYVLVDAGFDSLIRPAMYGAYHHISILGRDDAPVEPRVVAGPLCESADMFTQTKGGVVEPRPLPEPRVGDLLCVHDAGAYASSMASNYNSRLIAPEILVDDDGARLIRRRQTFDDLIAPELELGEEPSS